VKLALMVPLSPSVTTTSSTESDGEPSSSMIVPMPSPSVIVALPGFVSSTLYVSLLSSTVSP
jgi:hypothetical protein